MASTPSHTFGKKGGGRGRVRVSHHHHHHHHHQHQHQHQHQQTQGASGQRGPGERRGWWWSPARETGVARGTAEEKGRVEWDRREQQGGRGRRGLLTVRGSPDDASGSPPASGCSSIPLLLNEQNRKTRSNAFSQARFPIFARVSPLPFTCEHGIREQVFFFQAEHPGIARSSHDRCAHQKKATSPADCLQTPPRPT